MRTTLNIDDDVLAAAHDLARRRKSTAGAVLSELARQAMTSPPATVTRRSSTEFHGFRPLPREPGRLVTNALIDRLREEAGE